MSGPLQAGIRTASGILLIAALAGPFVAPAPAVAQDAPLGQAERSVAAEENAPADDNSAGEAAERAVEPEPAQWIDRVDAWFGDHVVGPAASVIFFDFRTGPWTDSEGVEHPGWLGTSVPFVVAWLLLGGIFLTLRMGFINIRAFWHAIRLTKGDYDDPSEPGEVSHFQALSAALSATVGLGNIGGVAVAIGSGGPGAAFWLVLVGVIGMSTKFTECTLGQMYRTIDRDKHVLGGPMRYLKVGLQEMGLGWLGTFLSLSFAVLCIGASFGGGNAYQVGQSLSAIQTDIPFLQQYPWVYGLVMAALVGLVIIGGIRSIGAVAGRIVPLMCIAYMAAALYILWEARSAVPAAFSAIFEEAFEPNAIYGGFLGVMVLGITRAVFSNEAGVGSAPIAHSAARTDEPVSEGIVALLEPFIDTVLVCTTTALVIIVTGVYNDPANAEIVEAKEGAALTLAAFRDGGHHWFGYFLFVAVVLFAFSTCISWSYYGERSFVQLFGERSSLIYKALFLVFTFLGSIITRGNILEFSDLMILGMSLPNLLGVFLLSGKVRRALDDYWGKYKHGLLDKIV